MPNSRSIGEGVTSRRAFFKASGAAALATTGLSAVARADTPSMVYGYVDWSDALAITYVGTKLIQDHFGIKVEPLQAQPAVVYAAMQSGKVDVFSNSYMQGLGPLKGVYQGGQADYVKRVASSIEIVGVSEGPMTQGFAVPDYVTVDSIEQLNDNAAKFPDGIIGIDPGSGLMQSADKTVSAYGLKLNLVEGSEAAMEAAFERAYARKDWIVVTTWQPLPMWTKYNMRYLTDPKQTMMAEPYYCFHAVRNNFKTSFPKAYDFFTKFHLPNEEEAKIMSWIDQGMAPEDAASKWVDGARGKGIIEPWLT